MPVGARSYDSSRGGFSLQQVVWALSARGISNSILLPECEIPAVAAVPVATDLAKARRQLETEVAVLELAHHLSRQQAPDPFSALRWQEAWERPSLDAKAYVCGVLDGKALAAREDLAEDLQVPLADLPGAAAPRMWVPLKVFRFGTRGILTADDDL